MKKLFAVFLSLFYSLAFASGVSSVSSYNPTNVAITGGTIGSTPVANLKPVFPLTVTGTDTLTAPLPAGAALTDMQGFVFESIGANTGAMTLNIGGLGAKPLTRKGGGAMAAGDIPAADYVTVVYYDLSTDSFHALMEGGSNVTPSADGTAAIGTSQRWARADHVHPPATQTWASYSVGATRVVGTTYTNATSNPIFVTASTCHVLANIATVSLTIAGVVTAYADVGQSGAGATGAVSVGGPVPPGATYVVGGSPICTWAELR